MSVYGNGGGGEEGLSELDFLRPDKRVNIFRLKKTHTHNNLEQRLNASQCSDDLNVLKEEALEQHLCLSPCHISDSL